MKIATWNINSIRLRVGHIANIDADIICIQEMKCQDHEVPIAALEEMGFIHNCFRGQKAYNGVGIFSKVPLTDVERLDFGGNDQARHISAVLPDGTRLHNFYIPAGGDTPDPETNPSFAHKLKFVEDMTEYFNSVQAALSLSGLNGLTSLRLESSLENGSEEEKVPPTPQAQNADSERSEGKGDRPQSHAAPELNHIIVGDFNIAPFEHDVWSHKQLLKVVSHTPPETERMDKMYKTLNWVDVSRHFVPMEEKCYTWWSYRNKDWKKSNRGRRLDHIWATPNLKDKLVGHEIQQDARDRVKPSDHVPIIVTFSF